MVVPSASGLKPRTDTRVSQHWRHSSKTSADFGGSELVHVDRFHLVTGIIFEKSLLCTGWLLPGCGLPVLGSICSAHPAPNAEISETHGTHFMRLTCLASPFNKPCWITLKPVRIKSALGQPGSSHSFISCSRINEKSYKSYHKTTLRSASASTQRKDCRNLWRCLVEAQTCFWLGPRLPVFPYGV